MKVKQFVQTVMVMLVLAVLTGCCCPRKASVRATPLPVATVVDPSQLVQVQPQIQPQPMPQPTPVVAASSRPKLMLYLFCSECQKYYTWKGGELPTDTQLYFWHPVAKEWRIYDGDYRTIMRQPPVREVAQCPYHR